MAWNLNHRPYLKSFTDGNALMYLGFKGQNFTWVREVEGVIVLQERLDRGLINEEWLFSWPDTCISHLARTGSDHCPLLLTTDPLMTKGRKLFRFEAYWAEDPECKEVVSNQWALGIGHTMQKKKGLLSISLQNRASAME